MGNVKGLGSRVELLASGTDTTTATASTVITDVSVPAWCDSLVFTARVGVTTGANLVFSAPGYIDDTYAATSSDMSTTTIATPTLSHFVTIGMGARFPFAVTTIMSTNSHIRAYSVFLARYVRITRSYSVAPVGPSIQWVVYGYGG